MVGVNAEKSVSIIGAVLRWHEGGGSWFQCLGVVVMNGMVQEVVMAQGVVMVKAQGIMLVELL